MLLVQLFLLIWLSKHTATMSQQGPKRIFIENIAFAISRRTLVEFIQQATGIQDFGLQVIRKGTAGQMWAHGACSAIITLNPADDIEGAIASLNAFRPPGLVNILANPRYPINAGLAYLPGARSLSRGTSSGSNVVVPKVQAQPLVPRPPSFPPPPPVLDLWSVIY